MGNTCANHVPHKKSDSESDYQFDLPKKRLKASRYDREYDSPSKSRNIMTEKSAKREESESIPSLDGRSSRLYETDENLREEYKLILRNETDFQAAEMMNELSPLVETILQTLGPLEIPEKFKTGAASQVTFTQDLKLNKAVYYRKLASHDTYNVQNLPKVGPIRYIVSGDSYQGQLKNSKRHGQGTSITSSGAYYTGQWQENLENGYGRLIYENGNVYQGEFIEGLASGEGVLTKYSDCSVYKGQFQNNLMHGEGQITYKDGSSYVGGWRKGRRHGKGRLVVEGEGVYEGQFLKGAMQGEGRFEYLDGRSYAGQWKMGLRHGVGVFRLNEEGLVYEGGFANGVESGQGKLKW